MTLLFLGMFSEGSKQPIMQHTLWEPVLLLDIHEDFDQIIKIGTLPKIKQLYQKCSKL